jgi:nicotinamide-nucleotide amidase
MNHTKLMILSEKVGAFLLAQNQRLATAESCTGGLLAEMITAVPGSSQWLDVPSSLIDELGAVSEATVIAMVKGIFKHCNADVGVSVSGIAGPSGGSIEKPVGTVCLGYGTRQGLIQAHTYHFEGNREQIRQQSAYAALTQILAIYQ